MLEPPTHHTPIIQEAQKRDPTRFCCGTFRATRFRHRKSREKRWSTRRCRNQPRKENNRTPLRSTSAAHFRHAWLLARAWQRAAHTPGGPMKVISASNWWFAGKTPQSHFENFSGMGDQNHDLLFQPFFARYPNSLAAIERPCPPYAA